MIERYSLPEMAAIWSEANKLAVWKEVETLVVEAWADLGVGSIETAAALRAAPEVGIDAWKERETVTNHDVAAFVDLLAESVDVGGEWVHFGLTSSDVVDTANGVLLREAADLLLSRIAELFKVIQARALANQSIDAGRLSVAGLAIVKHIYFSIMILSVNTFLFKAATCSKA